MSFLLIVTLCNALTNECDNYKLDSGLNKVECTSQLKTETMPFYMQQIWMLDSFSEASCVPDTVTIFPMKYLK